MVKQKKEVRARFHVGISTLILFVLMAVIPLLFFFLLAQQTGAPFGFSEVLFAITFAIFMTLVLVWIKHMIINNPYLGVFIGLLLLVSFEYLLFFKYNGPYTTVFAIITGVLVVAYLGFEFIKHRTEEVHQEESYD